MTSQTGTLEITHRYAAPPERVYDAWLDPALITRWFAEPSRAMGKTPDEIVRVEVDARVGGRYSFVVRREGEELEHTGEYRVLDRPRKLAFTFGVPKLSPDASEVTLVFTPDGTGTLCTLHAARVTPGYEEATAKGWSAIVAGIGTILGA